MLKDNHVFLSLPAHGFLIIRSLGLSIVDRLIPTDLAICFFSLSLTSYSACLLSFHFIVSPLTTATIEKNCLIL